MRRVEVPESEVPEFLRQNTQLAEGKAEESSGKRKTEASKEFLKKWLLDHRDIDLDKLSVGEVVSIEIPGKDGFRSCFTITRKNSGNRLDGKRLVNEEPAIAARFTGPTAATYFDAVPQPK